LFDYENRDAIFVAVHRSFKFSLLTLGRNVASANFAFFLTDPAQLAETERRFTLTPDDIARINPNTKTAPVFRSRRDAELTAKIYAQVPVLIDESKGARGNPWGISFMRMLDMSNDSGLFRTAAELQGAGFVRDGSDWVASEGMAPRQRPLDLAGGSDSRNLALVGGGLHTPQRYVPLYEAKMIHQFDHRWVTYDGVESRDVLVTEKAHPDFEPTPRYWVPETEAKDRLSAKGWQHQWLMGWRDITNATNERTVIAAAFPRVGTGDTLLLMLPTVEDQRLYLCLVANLCSIALDYAARQKIGGTHLKYNVFKQLPVLAPAIYRETDILFILSRAIELSHASRAMWTLAKDVGCDAPPFSWDENRRAQLRAELDAWYARAYGLTRDELRYILDPADVMGPDYPSETFRVLKNNEIRRYGEYRTRRLVLEAWDRLVAGDLV
jgi:hypothetical protein